MGQSDHFDSMSELLRQTDKADYEIVVEETGRDGRVVVMAPHAGGIEPYTEELARDIAADELAFYAFRGLMAEGNYDLLHVKSTNFDEDEAIRLAKRAQVVLAVHGKSGDGEFAMIGGRHPELVREGEILLEDLGIETRDPPRSVAARSRDNICNRCRQGGVQLELSIALRKRLASQPDLLERFSGELRARCRRAVGG